MTQATWQFKTQGSVASASGTHTTPLPVPLPGGITHGDVLILWGAQGGAGRNYTLSDAAFVSVQLENGDGTVQLWAKIATGSESSLTISSSDDSWTVYAGCERWYGGVIASVAAMLVDTPAVKQNNGSTYIYWPAFTPSQNNQLIKAITGGYWSTSVSSNLDVPSPWTSSRGLAHDTQFVCGSEDVIQTTATSISIGHWTPTSSGTAGYASIIAAFLPGSLPATGSTQGFFTEAAVISPLAWIIRRRQQRARERRSAWRKYEGGILLRDHA